MKKLFAVLAISLLSAVMLFAAGQKETAKEVSTGVAKMPDSIDVWAINNPSELIIKAYDDAAAAFTAESGIKVNFIRIPTNDFHTKLVTSISAGVYPDMIIWNSSPGVEFSSTGKVVPMDNLVNEIGRNEFGEGALKMYTVKGTLLEVPFLVRPAGLHARKDLLQKAGYDTTYKVDADGNYYLEGLKTWDDMIAAGKKMNDPANGKYGLGFAFSRKAFGDSAGFAFLILADNGARVLGEDGKVSVDTPEFRAGLDQIRRFWESGAVPEAATTWDGGSNNQFFIAGDLGMCFNSNSIAGKLKDTTAVKPDQLIQIPVPTGPAGSYCTGNPESLTVFDTPAKAGAMAFVKYLLKPETQVSMFKTMQFGYYSPLMKSVQKDPLFQSLSDNEKVLMQNAAKTIAVSFPSEPDARLTALYSAFFYDDILSHIAVDGWSNDKIIEDCVKKANEALFD